ncbi:2-C-methyl-D-erythritol 4-phosphate cytidylyltransferase [Marinicellulosiphila megalodicopiae]|uniref:2-C-methyl-D-erythritol 4-phosphate cytidylyltransferase n=1 Tax=Marinicellulosiphila megalodicopiae TaxID=2724896 RepID=UPI003BB15775
MINSTLQVFWIVIPASGIGSRMQADIPKQYLKINNQSILEITLNTMAKLKPAGIVTAISSEDRIWPTLTFDFKVQQCLGGEERVNSVLNALKHIQLQDQNNPWVLVHDAARPCVDVNDIHRLIEFCQTNNQGGILANKVVDTLKQHINGMTQTIDRRDFWQAQTPQCFRLNELLTAIETGIAKHALITDEASAMELCGHPVGLVESKRSNIKITQPEDLVLAEFYLTH